MTNIETQFSGALFSRANTPGGIRQLNQAQPAGEITGPTSEKLQMDALVPPPSILAGQIVSRINQSHDLSLAFKREAIMMTALIDGVAPSGRQQVLLQALSSQIARQEQGAVSENMQNASLEDADQLFEQTREAILVPAKTLAEVQDPVRLSPQARARAVFDGFKTPELQEVARHLGREAVAEIFGEPPGVRQPAQNHLPDIAKVGLPHEVRQARAAQRDAILSRITAGRLPE